MANDRSNGSLIGPQPSKALESSHTDAEIRETDELVEESRWRVLWMYSKSSLFKISRYSTGINDNTKIVQTYFCDQIAGMALANRMYNLTRQLRF